MHKMSTFAPSVLTPSSNFRQAVTMRSASECYEHRRMASIFPYTILAVRLEPRGVHVAIVDVTSHLYGTRFFCLVVTPGPAASVRNGYTVCKHRMDVTLVFPNEVENQAGNSKSAGLLRSGYFLHVLVMRSLPLSHHLRVCRNPGISMGYTRCFTN
jgi:hypothetical protein